MDKTKNIAKIEKALFLIKETLLDLEEKNSKYGNISFTIGYQNDVMVDKVSIVSTLHKILY